MRSFLSILLLFILNPIFAQTWQELKEKGDDAFDQQDYTNAESYYKQSLLSFKKSQKDESLEYAGICQGLGMICSKLDKFSESEQYYLDAKNIRGKLLGKGTADYALSCNNLALLYYNHSLFDKAETLYKEAINVYVNTLGKEYSNYALY